MMDTSEATPTSSEDRIESTADEVSPVGHSVLLTKDESGTADNDDDDNQSRNTSNVSRDQSVPSDDGKQPDLHHPTPNSKDVPESSSMNGLMDGLMDSRQSEGNDEEDMDSASEISDFSDFSQESWHPVQGPIAWVQEQMRQGQNARTILEDLVPPGTTIPDDIDPIMLWRLIINIVSEPPKRKKLENINTLEDVISLMQTCNKIIVLTGAGVSVSCGIPDFRSRDGVYARLAVDFPNLPDPQAMFDIHFFRSDPRPFFKFAKEIYPGQFKPSLCHHFIRLIESQGKLLRNYTQNIDTLEQEAGIERVVQCHGSFATATCTNCKLKVKADVVREDIFKQVIPKCPQCPEGTENSIMKPDIVFFGESLPEDFHKQMAQDKDECDLLIVIGSSLKVRPVALIPNSVPAHVPQILINRERLHYLNFDVELLGNCDDIVGELCHRLGKGWDQLAPPQASPLTEVLLSSLPTPPSSPQSQDLAATTSASSPSSKHRKPKKALAIDGENDKESPREIDDSSESSSVSISAKNKATTASEDEKKNDVESCHNKACCVELEKESFSCVDCSSSDMKGDSTEMSNVIVGTPQDNIGDDGNVSKPPASSVASVSDLLDSCKSLNKSDKLELASSDEVSTTSTSAKSTDNCRLKAQQGEDQSQNKVNTESDIVSSTSNEHNKINHHKHHHHHSSHHHHDSHNHSHPHHHHRSHHHHKHHGHNHHHRHHHHHHHHQESCTSGKSSMSEHKNVESCSDKLEPIEKRPRLELEEESATSSINVASNDDSEMMSSTSAKARESILTDGEDDELEEMRKMWQGRKNRVSLAQRLSDNQYLFLPPNRYVFKGAEVFSESEEEDESDDNQNDDDDANENNDGNSNDVSLDAEELEEQQQVVEIEETSVNNDNDDLAGEKISLVAGSISSSPSAKSSLPAVAGHLDEKDRAGIVSSTNNDGNEKCE